MLLTLHVVAFMCTFKNYGVKDTLVGPRTAVPCSKKSSGFCFTDFVRSVGGYLVALTVLQASPSCISGRLPASSAREESSQAQRRMIVVVTVSELDYYHCRLSD